MFLNCTKQIVKVLLIHSFLTVAEDDPAGISPVLGLAYIASYLEKNGIDVEILDIAAEGINQVKKIGNKKRYGLSENEIKKRIRKASPDIVGITSISTPHSPDAHEAAKIAKKVFPKVPVVMGGAHPSANPDEVLKDKNVDIVVRGEGEITFLEIVKKYERKEKLDGIPGTCVRRGRGIAENPPRPYVKDIDSLPLPAYHLLPMETYIRENQKEGQYEMRDRLATMITSRGCPGNCIYCSVRVIWGRQWRGRSPENVVDEIQLLMKDYQINTISFLDDSISVNAKRLEGICDEIIKRKLDIRWTTPNGIAIWLLNKKIIEKMKKAGCYRLTFGLESGNKEVLNNFIGKHYDYRKAKEMIRYCSDIGLWTIGTFIIGFPYETREQIEDTIKFAISTDLDFAVFYIANPRRGTPLYEIYKKENLLPEGGDHTIIRGTKTKNFSHEELINLQSEAFNRFLKSRLKKPWRFFSKIRSWEDFGYTVKLGKNYLKILADSAVIKSKGIASLWRQNKEE